MSAGIDGARARKSRNIARGGVCVLPCAARWCRGVTRASFLSFRGSLITPSYRAALRRDSIADDAEPKCVVRPVEMAARIDARCNFAGRRNIASGSVRRLTCADFRCRFVARSAQALRVMFGMPTSSCPSFAIGSTVLGALAAGGPTHVTNFKMSVVADPAQYLPRRAAAQMLQEYREGRKPKLNPAPAIVPPLCRA